MSMTAFVSNVLDSLDEARSAEIGLQQIDQVRRAIAGPGVFSIHLNVTTARHPINEVLLQRLYSSAGGQWPVNGTKRKTLTPWTETIFLRCQPFIGEGAEALARAFDDYEQMKAAGLRSVVNVPLLCGTKCYATFNVFGTRDRWEPREVVAIRLLALTAQRWVSPLPELMYRLDSEPAVVTA